MVVMENMRWRKLSSYDFIFPISHPKRKLNSIESQQFRQLNDLCYNSSHLVLISHIYNLKYIMHIHINPKFSISHHLITPKYIPTNITNPANATLSRIIRLFRLFWLCICISLLISSNKFNLSLTSFFINCFCCIILSL